MGVKTSRSWRRRRGAHMKKWSALCVVLYYDKLKQPLMIGKTYGRTRRVAVQRAAISPPSTTLLLLHNLPYGPIIKSLKLTSCCSSYSRIVTAPSTFPPVLTFTCQLINNCPLPPSSTVQVFLLTVIFILKSQLVIAPSSTHFRTLGKQWSEPCEEHGRN